MSHCCFKLFQDNPIEMKENKCTERVTFIVFVGADPSEQRHQLATVTNAKTERVAAATELFKLSPDALVEADCSSPPYIATASSRLHNIASILGQYLPQVP